MNPSTPKTDPPPSTQLRKAVLGSSHKAIHRLKDEQAGQWSGVASISVMR